MKYPVAISTRIIFACLFLLLLSYPTDGLTSGFQLFNELSARATGMGAALTARNDVAESAWFNPAAVATMKSPRIMAGTGLIVPSMKLDTTGHDPDMKNMAYALPYTYLSIPYGKRFGLSLAINAPYGLETEWDPDWAGKYYAVDTDLKCLFFTPSISFRPASWLSLGAGAQIVKARAEMKRSVTPLVQGLRTRLLGDDWGKGYLLSVLATPGHGFSLGMVFRSQVILDLDGHAEYNMHMPGFYRSRMTLPLTLPASLSIGLTYRGINAWTISADLVYTWWSSYDALDFHYRKAPGTGRPAVIGIPKDWDDVYSLRFGAEYSLGPNWQLRGSYVFDPSPIDDRYRDPSLPTNDRHIFSVGIGYTRTHLGLDAAYSYVKIESSRPSPVVTPMLKGTYKGDAHVVNCSIRWTF